MSGAHVATSCNTLQHTATHCNNTDEQRKGQSKWSALAPWRGSLIAVTQLLDDNCLDYFKNTLVSSALNLFAQI